MQFLAATWYVTISLSVLSFPRVWDNYSPAVTVLEAVPVLVNLWRPLTIEVIYPRAAK